jgi:hypothetical protein
MRIAALSSLLARAARLDSMRHAPSTYRARRRPAAPPPPSAAPAAAARSPLDLGSAARAALRDGAGPWRDCLELAAAIERHDRQVAAHRADDFGGLTAMLDCAEQAWVAERDAG